jgi:hypothetical protein
MRAVREPEVPPLSDAEIESLLEAERDSSIEMKTSPFQMATSPERHKGLLRWVFVFMLILMLIGSWVKP